MADPEPDDQAPPAAAAARLRLDRGLLFVIGFALTSAAACYLLRGAEAFWRAFESEGGLVLKVLPTIFGSIMLGALLRVLVPERTVRTWLGEGSGITGLAIATVAGMLVPGGPITSFPLVVALIHAGADIGVCIAFLTSWELLGLMRVIVWEMPFMGGEFVAVRMAASCLLPIVAGALARRLPIRVTLPEETGR